MEKCQFFVEVDPPERKFPTPINFVTFAADSADSCEVDAGRAEKRFDSTGQEAGASTILCFKPGVVGQAFLRPLLRQLRTFPRCLIRVLRPLAQLSSQ
jgi:hypothetical protein